MVVESENDETREREREKEDRIIIELIYVFFSARIEILYYTPSYTY